MKLKLAPWVHEDVTQIYDDGLSGPPQPKLSAAALATAFVADIEAATPLKAALLRKEIGAQGLERIVLRDLEAGQAGKRGPALFPNVRKAAGLILRSQGESKLAGGLGQWAELAGAIGAAAGAAAKIYSSVADADAQKQLLKLAQERNQATLAIAQLQAKTAQVQLAQANVQAGSIVQGTMGPEVAGVPLVVAGGAAAAIAVAVAVYFATKKR